MLYREFQRGLYIDINKNSAASKINLVVQKQSLHLHHDTE